ncbi:MAG: adenosylmethionine--8-amino-7-oxononanoate transaminase [Nitrospinae bacterium]|nr:adenosylmethionine--8-amino-7-oxononanoate transaminase [Nitrospinota bacterium]
MIKGFFVTGTDTGVGKTVVAAGLSAALNERGINTGVMKPIQSGEISKDGELVGDTRFLIEAAGVKDEVYLINPYHLEAPLAPIIASRIQGIEIDVEKIKGCFEELAKRHEIVIVEGIGGLLVPIREDYLVSDLIIELNLPIIIISRTGIGTINHTLLTVRHAQYLGIEIAGIVFNNPDKEGSGEAERMGTEEIKRLTGIPILGTLPHIPLLDPGGNLKVMIEKEIDLDILLNIITENVRCDIRKGFEEDDKRYIWHPFTQMKDWIKETPLIIEEGEGSYLKDIYGNRYIDGVSSLWVTVHGHRREEIDRAIIRQIRKVSHSTLLGLSNIPAIRLAERLVGITPDGLNKVFYSDNGSTAVEVGVKMAFQYWQQRSSDTKRKKGFISLKNAYHGDTIGSVSVGGIDLFHQIYRPLLFSSYKGESPYCYRCALDKSYPSCGLACADQLEGIMKERHEEISAMVIEPMVQGAGGMIVSPPGYLRRVRELCTRYNILMIADEVATGFGRSGKMFACDHEEVRPDIMAIAKGISGGYLPLSATLTTDEIYEAFGGDYSECKTFFHGHTYTGNPLACAAGIANLEVFEKEKTIERLNKKIVILKDKLKGFEEFDHVGDIRQLGFMVGIELVKEKGTREPYLWEDKIGIKVTMEARKRGLIIRPLGNVIVLMPPLSISEEDLDKMLDIVYRSIESVS